jgi:hypothetical protein
VGHKSPISKYPIRSILTALFSNYEFIERFPLPEEFGYFLRRQTIEHADCGHAAFARHLDAPMG